MESAIAHAFASFDGKDLYPSIEEKAARQAYAIIRNHPFLDGNKPTGLFVMLIFLELNGMRLFLEEKELEWLGLGVADGSINYNMIVQWINDHRLKSHK